MRVGKSARLSLSVGLASVLAAATGFVFTLEAQQSPPGPPATASPQLSLVEEYCLSCHDEDHKKGGLALESVAADGVPRHPDVWEKVVRKLRARQMPPVGKERPARQLPAGDHPKRQKGEPRGVRPSSALSSSVLVHV